MLTIHNGRDLVLVFSGELAGCGKQLHEQLRQLMRSIEQKRRIKLFAAFGSLQDDPLRLNQSYQDARRVAELSLVLPAGSVMEYRKQYFDDESELVPRIDFEKLEAAIYEGNSEEIISIWSSWKQRVSAATPNPQLVRSYVAETMCRLIVLNTASIQLIPSTVGAVRASLGSARPFDILPAVWLTSACSVTAGLLAARLFSRWWRA